MVAILHIIKQNEALFFPDYGGYGNGNDCPGFVIYRNNLAYCSGFGNTFS